MMLPSPNASSLKSGGLKAWPAAAAAVFLGLLLAGIWPADSVRAEGFAVYTLGARNEALSGAVMARKPDSSAVAANPALLTRMKSNSLAAGMTVIGTKGALDWESGGRRGRTGAHSAYYFLPHAFFNYKISDRFFLGIGQFSRFGLGNEYTPDWPGRFNVYKIELLSTSLNPSLAWKATEKLSLAAGIELMYVSLSLRQRVPLVPGVAEADAFTDKADDLGVGFNLAAHYQFSPQWALGIQYRSPVRIQAKGDIRFQYKGPDDPFLKAAFAAAFQDGTVRGTVTLPESISAGLAYTPTSRLSLEAILIWTRWTRIKSLDMYLPGNMPLSRTPKRWRNTWRAGIGAEYALLDWLDLRLGYNFTESPMNSQYADYNVPTKNRHTYTFGLGFHNDRWSLDVSYLFIDCLSRSYQNRPDLGTVKSQSRGVMAHEMAMTVTYNF
jgi:long-chain fatty acid transport protein